MEMIQIKQTSSKQNNSIKRSNGKKCALEELII